jgi:Secretion system C-terminal sorting domain
VELSVQNPLPVTLRSFTASVTDANVKLDWSTASESNNRGFEIQRSDDGVKFVPIGFVDGAGTSQTIQKYTFLDRGRPNGRFFYRLKQVDYDNRFSLSNILSVEINGTLSFELGQSYPNPTHGAATITYSVPVKTNVRLVLYDGQGRVVSVLQNGERSAGKYAVTVPENLLKSGIYYYKIDAGGFTTTRKMIVQ